MAASGTGGHLFPALAVAKQLTDCDIEWLGTPDRLETELVPGEYRRHTVTAKGLQGKPLQKLKNGLQLLASVFQTHKILGDRRIDLVFTTGGYIAAPAILAARWRRIPVILHESNVLPGKVTRFLGKYATAVVIGFQESAQYLPKARTLHLGTPVRPEFLTPQALDLNLPGDRPLILVMGGSQGAVGINQLVRQCAVDWIAAGAVIVHITGKNDPDVAQFQDPHYFPLPFTDKIAALLQRASVVVSRSGASALTELTITKTAAILIPYPYAAEDHQTINAQVFVKHQAGLLAPQKDLTPERLSEMVLDLLRHPAKREAIAANAATLGTPQSAEQIADFLRTTLSL